MEPSQPADTNNTKLVRRARDTYTLEIKQNRNNPGPVQLEGTEEMIVSSRRMEDPESFSNTMRTCSMSVFW